jgi:hypothetical protein
MYIIVPLPMDDQQLMMIDERSIIISKLLVVGAEFGISVPALIGDISNYGTSLDTQVVNI